jgi:hypothetical protein
MPDGSLLQIVMITPAGRLRAREAPDRPDAKL